jgi:hypothetical protein
MWAIKSPLKGGLISGLAILSPTDPYRAALKALQAYTAGLFNLLKDLLPCFSGFCFESGDGDSLDLLNSWRGYQALDATANQFI